MSAVRGQAEIAETGRVPGRLSSAVFLAKAMLLRARRAARDLAGSVRRHLPLDSRPFPYEFAQVRSPLWSGVEGPERRLELGKAQNLRAAARRLDGVVVPAGEMFSFWKQVGRCTRRRGFVSGRQLQEGCLIPAVGGGLCQLSNALYEAALRAGVEVVERHPHTRIVPGSAAAQGRDATVAWNYLDLRLRAPAPFRLEVRLTRDELVVRIFGAERPATRQAFVPRANLSRASYREGRSALDPLAHSCTTCGQDDCHRHRTVDRRDAFGRTAFLVDDLWPEYDLYLQGVRNEEDALFLPLDGTRRGRKRYGWNTRGFGRVREATLQTLWRAARVRGLAQQGAARQMALLAGAEALARRFGAWLEPEHTRLVVIQGLLPFLWRNGHLGGRTFEVLMTRLPMRELHRRLDAALAAHPERATLRDFRAPAWMVEAEEEALNEAERVVTPHAEVASVFPGRSLLLPWQTPEPEVWTRGEAILFPGPTVGRKGAFEVREAARRLGLEVVLLRSELEGEGFWEGVWTRRSDSGAKTPLEGVFAVVQPALVEDQPRALLRALASGCPVLATGACGLGEKFIEVHYGDVEELVRTLQGLRYESPAAVSR